MIMYMAIVIQLIIGRFVILMIKNAIIRKIKGRQESAAEHHDAFIQL